MAIEAICIWCYWKYCCCSVLGLSISNGRAAPLAKKKECDQETIGWNLRNI